ncbi:MAG: hypothetical protein BWY79_02205 [Actinobacteria bacterium ADurb.Bin444]|nr:MAG: hypothetical protein BWY79_02205 [Actinobacteria bacterium ADurb.Bin444]
MLCEAPAEQLFEEGTLSGGLVVEHAHRPWALRQTEVRSVDRLHRLLLVMSGLAVSRQFDPRG